MRRFVLNALFLVLLVFVVVAAISSCQSISVPDNAALLINPRGTIVEQTSIVDPLQGLVGGASQVAEVELSAILTAIDRAAADDNIKMMILNLDELIWSAPAHNERIGHALAKFKDTGKKVAAYGHFFVQHQYQVASFADALYLHPQGQVLLQGYGTQNFYFKELLEKFDVNMHVFRAGTYKSIVEPYLRNDMSEEARLASETLYANLWQNTLQTIAENRRLEVEEVRLYTDQLALQVAAVQGDLARAALENHLVDELLKLLGVQLVIGLLGTADDSGAKHAGGEERGQVFTHRRFP